jgi:hypothetical protein
MDVVLPERADWTVSEARGWIHARHEAADLSLSARAWRAAGVVNRGGCAVEARRSVRALPHLAPEEVVRVEDLDVPSGYDTRVEVAVRSLPDGVVEGVLAAFGARIRRCVALLAVTRARGPGAERVVMSRLGLLATHTARSLSVRRIEDRVPVRGF